MFDPKKTGAFIASERRAKGMTQEELAEKLGVSNRSVSRWETGRTMPDYSLLEPLCALLSISINELFSGGRVPPPERQARDDKNLLGVWRENRRMKKTNAGLIAAGAVMLALILFFAVRVLLGGGAIAALFLGSVFAKPEVTSEIGQYEEVIGPAAKEEYRNKWDMKEEIFPQKIAPEARVEDFKMVYYNPWDAQYLCWLALDYESGAYEKEVARLKALPSDEYRGIYGVRGFSSYELLAVNADEYQGFVYALTDGKGKIVYVELIFCNYAYDLKYEEYIPSEYLPDGFDAHSGNAYERQEREKHGT